MLTNQFFAYIIFTFLVFVDISYCLNDFRSPRQILGIFSVDESNYWESDNIPYEGQVGDNTPSRFWAPNQILLERKRSGVTTNRVMMSCVSITPDVLTKSGRSRESHNYNKARISNETINGVKDHAGHIIAHKLGGSYHDKNIISQNPNCNTGYWKTYIEGIIEVSSTNITRGRKYITVLR
uniref:Type VII secretion system protein EssD-like domain-containing protein n=1 Tax=Schizaphis graminum TaxID=13262 RepID=A0A2S2PC42_SCHGA